MKVSVKVIILSACGLLASVSDAAAFNSSYNITGNFSGNFTVPAVTVVDL